MANFSAEDAKKKYESLPPEVKALLYTPGMSFTIQQIGQKNKLHIDQIDVLNTETGQLMLGFVDPKDFGATLMEMLSVDRMKADALVQDINDMLLAPIREAMKKVSIEATPPSNNLPPNTIQKEEPSVIMPSAAVKPATSIPTAAPTIPPKPPTASSNPPAAVSSVPKLIEIHAADLMLNEPTVSMPPKAAPTSAPSAPAAPASPTLTTPKADSAKVEPPKPAPYKADPYREPPE